MHELPVVKELLETVLQVAEEEKAGKVLAVSLEIGGMHDLVEEWVIRFFDYINRGTIAEGAKLTVQKNPVLIRCRGCREGAVFDPHGHLEFTCPRCGAQEFDLINGNEFIIRKIEVV